MTFSDIKRNGLFELRARLKKSFVDFGGETNLPSQKYDREDLIKRVRRLERNHCLCDTCYL